MEEDKVLEERKKKFLNFLKKDKWFSAFFALSLISFIFSLSVKIGFSFFIIGMFSSFIWLLLGIFSALSASFVYFNLHKLVFYPILAWVVWLAVYIRTLNLSLLRDVTTGAWTLGPDLDPFLFLRWAKYIVANGSLMINDVMRYVPLGYNVREELIFLPYLMAWFHKIAVMFGSVSVEQSAAIFPAFMFLLTVIAFFFLVRKIFLSSMGNTKSSIIALIASFFLSVIPVFIPRTIAGIPEKESAAFVFLFAALCFFLYAWDAKKLWARISLSVLSGASTAAMTLIWGGYIFIFITIALSVFLAFILGQIDWNKFLAYLLWLIFTIILTLPFTERFSLLGWITSPATGMAFGILGIIAVHFMIFNTNLKKYAESAKFSKLPRPIFSFLIAAILGLITISVLFGPSFIFNFLDDIKGHLINPITDRLGVTVAENRQPFFSEWADSFGPSIKGIPLTFWLFFIGSVYLFYFMIKVLPKKERIITTLGYLAWLFCIIFSRYSQDSMLNGTNNISLIVYFFGFLALVGIFGYYYYKHYRLGEQNKFKEIEFGLILLFSLFFLCIVAARGAIRLVMMLVPPAAIIVSYFLVSSLADARNIKDNTLKIGAWFLVIIIILSGIFSAQQFYSEASATGSNYAPSSYNQQWQKAMSWVRDNTSKDAVFGHWWDYGYWLQSIGERATVLDGGNSIPYWDHLMGRHALTGQSDEEALEFLYAHNTTHFLIDSTDIGKYPAFSSIGSDENYDRYSWLNTFVKDSRQTQETKNTTLSVYIGGSPIDGDINYNANGTNIFLPAEKAGLGAVIVEKNINGEIISSPIGIFIYQNKQYRIPLRYAFEEKLIDFGSGLEAGIFLMPRISQTSQGVGMDKDGALIYLSSKTVKSQLARLYLYNEIDDYFKLVHSEDDFIVKQLKDSNVTGKDIIFFEGIRGPIKIWEINYPSDMKLNTEYLKIQYPNIKLTIAK